MELRVAVGPRRRLSVSDLSFVRFCPEQNLISPLFIRVAEDTSELYKELLENEKKNFQLVRSAVRDLGGIPAMIHHADMSNTIPDEKVGGRERPPPGPRGERLGGGWRAPTAPGPRSVCVARVFPQVVITYLSFLCARLLDLRREARAARLIQTAWRKYRLRADRRRQQVPRAAEAPGAHAVPKTPLGRSLILSSRVPEI